MQDRVRNAVRDVAVERARASEIAPAFEAQ